MIYFAPYLIASFLRVALPSRQMIGVLFWAFLIFCFFFAAFRFEVGCDWSSYKLNFEIHQRSTFADAWASRQPFYISSFIGIGELGLDYRWFNVFACAIFFGGAAYLAKRQPDPLAFLVLCYPVLIINMPMSGMRQAIAIGIMCIAFVQFSERRPFLYGLWVVIATLFHSSALIFLALAPMIGNMPFRQRAALLVLLTLPGLAAIASSDMVEVATSRYIESDLDAAGALFRILPVTACGLLWILLLRKDWRRRFPHDAKLVWLASLMMLAVIFVLPVSSVIADRIAYYLMPLQAVIFARIPFLAIPFRKLFSIFPYVLLGGLFVSWMWLSDHFDRCYVPYESWLLV